MSGTTSAAWLAVRERLATEAWTRQTGLWRTPISDARVAVGWQPDDPPVTSLVEGGDFGFYRQAQAIARAGHSVGPIQQIPIPMPGRSA